MGSKDTYKSTVKVARQDLKDTVRQAFSDYKRTKRKAHLLRQQTEIKVELELMGVWSKQIPVLIMESKAVKIPVRVA